MVVVAFVMVAAILSNPRGDVKVLRAAPLRTPPGWGQADKIALLFATDRP